MHTDQSLLIENGTIVTVDDRDTVHSTGYVLVQGDSIAAVGAGAPPAAMKQQAQTVLDGTNMAVMPGMVNSHTHLFQSFIRGRGDDKTLLEWIKAYIWPIAENMTQEETYLAGLVGLMENIRCGGTAVLDHQYIHADPTCDDGFYRAGRETGVRLMLARGWADMAYRESLMESPEQIIAESTRLFETYHGSENGRLLFEFGPVIPWGCTDETMRKTYELAQKWGVGTHIHVAETREEVEISIKNRGKRHIEWLADLGILGPDVQLVHSVWLDDHELDLVQQHDAVIVHCPVSNMYLASGAARIPEMHKMGITIALASDGPGSNNNQDMMEVLKTTALLAKLSTLNAQAVLPEQVLRMACRGGSKAFGQPDKLGSLEVGKKADIVMVDLDTPFAMPVHNAVSALVYNLSYGSVDTVVVDGKILMKGKEILVVDEKEVLKEARIVCKKLFERAGVR
ncbi:MAG: amidohydrolase [Anaerolineaceae bacterium]|nr:amidohydrolase [Anaerolineaceae bacterium]